jgi:hypothetical protein
VDNIIFRSNSDNTGRMCVYVYDIDNNHDTTKVHGVGVVYQVSMTKCFVN